MLLVGSSRNFNYASSKSWRMPGGKLDRLVAAGQQAYVSEAAWQLYEMLSNQKPGMAQEMAALADSLGLTHPRLAHARARNLEQHGDHSAALSFIDKAAATRGNSGDRAWVDLLSFRDAVAARQVAFARLPSEPPPFRFGHSAPPDRPDRRRFTLLPPSLAGEVSAAVPAPTASVPKALARKRRAARAGR